MSMSLTEKLDDYEVGNDEEPEINVPTPTVSDGVTVAEPQRPSTPKMPEPDSDEFLSPPFRVTIDCSLILIDSNGDFRYNWAQVIILD